MKKISIIYLWLVLASCGKADESPIFQLLDGQTTGIDFNNKVANTDDFNIFNYRNFYNGGGVGIGDINNDGLQDIYFTANMGSNKLYLNKGNFKFEDITAKAGVADAIKWSTGVTFADINNDGWLDIYVCNAGYQKNIGQENSLFINNKDLTFTESAANYGLNDNSYTTHASFFDYDLDGDLDCYLLNNSFIPVNTLNNANNRNLRAKDWPVADFLKGGGDKLLRNDQGKFVDVSEETGIYGSLIGFGLGVTVGDVNQDNYPDIYVSNDFYEKDYLYINQRNGTFKEELEDRIDHTSFASMGADMADINNDGHPEIFATDMLPRTEERLKTTTAFDSHYTQKLRLQKGFYHQYMQNSLQLNNGNGTFNEIAYYADVAATDWSWGALIFDADNDGLSDIYVSNGIFHDVIDQDFIDFFADDLTQKAAMSGQKTSFNKILEKIPSRPQPNVFFKNKGQLKFEESSTSFGFDTPSFSNGAAYADLDNDGDLDLVVNNVNQPCFVYKNNTNILANHYYKINLKFNEQNSFAVGAKVDLYCKNEVFSKQIMPARGFQSSVEYPLLFGLGKYDVIDSMRISWPNQTYQIHKNIRPDTSVTFQYVPTQVQKIKALTPKVQTLFSEIENEFLAHQENEFEDFYTEKNIYQKLSTEGPKMAIGDLNGDGQQDVAIAGAQGQTTQIYIQQNLKFVQKPQSEFVRFSQFEDTYLHVFDADGDKDLDLYVGSGGNEYEVGSRELMDRLYLNDGRANFSIASKSLPNNAHNTAVVTSIDYDSDGDLDLFVGSRSYSKQYGLTPPSFLYQNMGNAVFKDITATVAPELLKLGMVRDAVWVSIDGDTTKELVVVGDWMAPSIFKYTNGKLQRINNSLSELKGFWGSIQPIDVNNDKQMDFVIGNMGENFPIKISADAPMKLWVDDVDKNGTVDKILAKTVDQKDVPVFLKREMMEQFPYLKSQNLKHSQFANKTIYDLFDNSILEQAQQKSVNELRSILAVNDGKGSFSIKYLPYQAQFSCINTMKVLDINKDGYSDLILAGNNSGFIPQFGSRDANKGAILINDTKGGFKYLPQYETGLNLRGDVKQIDLLETKNNQVFIALLNNRKPKTYILNVPKK